MNYLPAILAATLSVSTLPEKIQSVATTVESTGERSLKGWTVVDTMQASYGQRPCGVTRLWRYNDLGRTQLRIEKYVCPTGELGYRFDDHGTNGPDAADFVLRSGELVSYGKLSAAEQQIETARYEQFINTSSILLSGR